MADRSIRDGRRIVSDIGVGDVAFTGTLHVSIARSSILRGAAGNTAHKTNKGARMGARLRVHATVMAEESVIWFAGRPRG